MADPNIYSMLMADEPTAQEQAAAMVAALRKQRGQNDTGRAIGGLGLLTGDKVLGRFGAAQMQGADQSDQMLQSREQMLAGAGQHRLSAAMEKLKNDQAAKFHGQELGLEREKMGLSREKMAADKAAADKKGVTDQTESLRKELNQLPEIKQFKDVQVSFDKVKRSASDVSAAGDLGLIFGYMKMLDPGSSVREGEFANAQNATGVDGRIVNAYNNALSGQRLSAEQRKDFLNAAGNYYGAHETQAKAAIDRYRGLGSKAGANPDDIMPAIGGSQTAAAVTPPAAQDDEAATAVAWAKANPNDPRAATILQAHGVVK